MSSRRDEQILKGEDVNKFLHLSFDKKYKIKTLPLSLFSIFQIGFQATNNDKYIIPDYQRNLVWKLENKQHFLSNLYSKLQHIDTGEISGKNELISMEGKNDIHATLAIKVANRDTNI